LEKISLRERKKTKTWESLVKISTRLFIEQGYDNTTVDQIVEKAEVSQRTFFRYFPSKEAVMFRDYEKREQGLLRYLKEDEDGIEPYQRIKNALLGMANAFDQDRETMLAEYKIVMGSKHLIALDIEQDSRLERHVHAALREFRGRPFLCDRDAELVGGAIFGSIRSALGYWFEGGCKADLAEISGQCLKIVDVLAAGFPGRI